MVQILYPTPELIPGYHAALSIVALERVYIEMVEPPPIETTTQFQLGLIQSNGAGYYAVDNGKVVGWCDVFPMKNPRQAHRGGLGMGLIPEYRGQGIGSRLVDAVLAHAKKAGLEKVELNVYTTNLPAIALYKKHGFEQEGLIRKYRKLDGVYFDCLSMGKFL